MIKEEEKEKKINFFISSIIYIHLLDPKPPNPVAAAGWANVIKSIYLSIVVVHFYILPAPKAEGAGFPKAEGLA